MSRPTEAECWWRGLARIERVAIFSDSELPEIQLAAMHLSVAKFGSLTPVARNVAEKAYARNHTP
jgi:hypothetical protein